MLLSKRQRQAMAASIAHHAVTDAISGFLSLSDDRLVRLPTEMGPVYQCERLLQGLKRESVKLPAWGLGAGMVPKDGKLGSLYWAVTEMLWHYKPDFLYGPYNEALFALAASEEHGLLVDGKPAEALRSAHYPSQPFVEKIEAFLNAYISYLRTDKVRKQLSARLDKAAHQEATALGIMQAAFGCSSSLMVVAVDHALPGPVTLSGGQIARVPGYNDEVALQDLLRFRKKNVRGLHDHPQLEKHLLGCVQFLCGGPISGPYIHSMYFFRDGSMKPGNALNAIDSAWRRNTGGVGITHSTKKDDNPFKIPMGTRVHSSRADLVGRLERSIIFLTQKPLYFSPKVRSGTKTFWHSHRVRAGESGDKVTKQRSARDRTYSARDYGVDLAEHAPELLKSLEAQMRRAAKVKKPTPAEEFLGDDGSGSPSKKYEQAKYALEVSILQKVAVDRAVADRDLDRRAAKRVNAAPINEQYRKNIEFKFDRMFTGPESPVAGPTAEQADRSSDADAAKADGAPVASSDSQGGSIDGTAVEKSTVIASNDDLCSQAPSKSRRNQRFSSGDIHYAPKRKIQSVVVQTKKSRKAK